MQSAAMQKKIHRALESTHALSHPQGQERTRVGVECRGEDTAALLEGDNPGLLGFLPAHEQWYVKASIKTRPRPQLPAEELQQGKLPFSPDVLPIVQHPLFLQKVEMAAQTRLLTQALGTWLTGTECLELGVIIPMASRIATGELGITSPDLEFEAYQIVTDEAGHALVAKDLLRQMSAATGVSYERLGQPQFLTRLHTIKARLAPRLQWLIEVCFTVVSETLITSHLAKLPKDERVVSTVRAIIMDHARDEAAHHRYFLRFFEAFWPTLPASVHSEVSPLLPELIRAFLDPDLPQLRRQLKQVPALTEADIEQILTESYPPVRLAVTARTAAAATLRLFTRTGVLADPKAAEAFQTHGLIAGAC